MSWSPRFCTDMGTGLNDSLIILGGILSDFFNHFNVEDNTKDSVMEVFRLCAYIPFMTIIDHSWFCRYM